MENNMKWYNESKSIMVDLSKVSYYRYNKYNGVLNYIIDGVLITEEDEYISASLYTALQQSIKQVI